MQKKLSMLSNASEMGDNVMKACLSIQWSLSKHSWSSGTRKNAHYWTVESSNDNGHWIIFFKLICILSCIVILLWIPEFIFTSFFMFNPPLPTYLVAVFELPMLTVSPQQCDHIVLFLKILVTNLLGNIAIYARNR